MWMVNVVFSGRFTEPGDPATRTVRALQRREAGDVESDNLILLTVVLELKRDMALVAVDNKHSVHPNRLRMRIKVFEPGKP
jgi:hypothetical protein